MDSYNRKTMKEKRILHLTLLRKWFDLISSEDSQISSNDETSLNNNIKIKKKE